MLVFSTSDKGGTGRSVTSCNIAYRLAQSGRNVAYVDFDFGSPTAGALFEISAADRGSRSGGVHSFLLGGNRRVERIDVGAATDRAPLAEVMHRNGRLILLAGDHGGSELHAWDNGVIQRCAELLGRLEQEFHVVIVDLSAGRSAALDIALRATALPQLNRRTIRWLVFHRWTRQHILAAAGLVYGSYGLLENGRACGHTRERLLGSIRFVRTAVPSISAHSPALTDAQSSWLHEQDAELRKLASQHRVGLRYVLGGTPVEPVLLYREQVILDRDVNARIANAETVEAYSELARCLIDPTSWEA